MHLVKGISSIPLEADQLGQWLCSEQDVVEVAEDCGKALRLLCIQVDHLSRLLGSVPVILHLVTVFKVFIVTV